MFLTGFDAKTLNTLWVDKNLKYHGLMQSFSRTNRILNLVKTFGNIVCFRDLEQQLDDALGLFGDADVSSIVLLRSYKDYFEGHHILQQNIMNKEDDKLSLIPKEIIKNKNKFVYSQFNLIKLCSLHHNQLHKGIESDRRYLLDKVMKKKKYINSVLNEYKNLSDEDINNLMTYIYSQYNLNYNESVN